MKRRRCSSDLCLDDDCWEYVFKLIFLNDDEHEKRCYFKSLSIVNKQFLSITNRLRFSLTVWNPTRRLLSRLFPRFINLISLDLSCYYGDVDNLLVHISCFPLKLTSLNLSNQPNIPARGFRAFSRNITTITSLISSNLDSLSVADLFLISECFPLLQQLDLSSTNGINVLLNGSMSIMFPKLRKLNLSGYIYSSTNNHAWLLHLCKSSQFLEELVLLHCPFLTSYVASSICEIPTLKSLSISWTLNINSHLIDSLLSLKDLTCLDLSFSFISDQLLSAIATRGLPLKKLVLQHCRGYTYAGIFSLLSNCRCIQHLDLQSAAFLNDQRVTKLSLFFGHLVSINLSCCKMLTELSLLSLQSNCLSLSEIKMKDSGIGIGIGIDVVNYNSVEDFAVSPQLKSLHLGANSWLRDENIKIFAAIFPNLQLLDLSQCHNISGEGICQVLRTCCKIRDLNLYGCSRVKLHELNFEVPNLKVLNLSSTCVDDETLYVISKSCFGLLQLLLESCNYVTKKGIKHVVKNCKQLREINLMYCRELRPNIVDEMIFSRPSLRKITASPCQKLSNKKFSDKKRKFFSHYGCLLC